MGCDCIPFLSDQEIRDYYTKWRNFEQARESNTKYLNLSDLKPFKLIDPETLKCSRNGHEQCFESIITPYHKRINGPIVMLDLTNFDVSKLGNKFICKCYICESDVPLNLDSKGIDNLINAVTNLYSHQEKDPVKVHSVKNSMKESLNSK